MKITTNREQLSSALKMASRVISGKANTPIQSHIVMRADTDTLIIAATNGTHDIVIEMAAEVESDGSGCVPASALANAIDYAKQERIDIQFTEKDARVREGRRIMPIVNAASFPMIDKLPKEGVSIISAPASTIHAGIKSVGWAQYTREDREHFRSVYVTPHAGRLRFCATSGTASATRDFGPTEATKGCLLPTAYVGLIQSVIPSGERNAQLAFTDKRAVMSIDTGTFKIELGTAMMNAQWPYEMFLQFLAKIEQPDLKAEVLVEELCSVVSAVSRFTDDLNPGIFLEFGNNKLTVSAKSAVGSASDTIDLKCEGEFKIKVGPGYFIPAIESLPSETATIGYKTGNTIFTASCEEAVNVMATMRM